MFEVKCFLASSPSSSVALNDAIPLPNLSSAESIAEQSAGMPAGRAVHVQTGFSEREASATMRLSVNTDLRNSRTAAYRNAWIGFCKRHPLRIAFSGLVLQQARVGSWARQRGLRLGVPAPRLRLGARHRQMKSSRARLCQQPVVFWLAEFPSDSFEVKPGMVTVPTQANPMHPDAVNFGGQFIHNYFAFGLCCLYLETHSIYLQLSCQWAAMRALSIGEKQGVGSRPRPATGGWHGRVPNKSRS
jgi:hypothetical protein